MITVGLVTTPTSEQENVPFHTISVACDGISLSCHLLRMPAGGAALVF